MTPLGILTLLTIAALPSYLLRFHIGPIPTTALEVLLVITIAVWGIQKIKGRCEINHKSYKNPKPWYRRPSPTSYLLSVFLLAATISVFVSPDHRAAWGIWKAYVVEPVLFFLVLQDVLKNKLPSHTIIFALSIPALALSVYAIIQKFTGHGIPPPWDIERRVTSIFPYPNALGLFLAPIVPLMIGQLFHKKNPLSTIFFLFTVTTSILAIFFARSTGALIGLAAGLIVMATLYYIKKRNWKLLIASYALLVMVAAITLSQKNLRQELLLRDWSGHVHKTQWVEAWHMLRDRPILGAGLSGYQQALMPYHNATYIEIFQYPHNVFLTFWSETGLLGLVSFLGLIVFFCIIAFKNLRSTFCVLCPLGAMVVILIHGLVDVPYFKNDLAVMFWIVYALAIVPTHDLAPT